MQDTGKLVFRRLAPWGDPCKGISPGKRPVRCGPFPIISSELYTIDLRSVWDYVSRHGANDSHPLPSLTVRWTVGDNAVSALTARVKTTCSP